MGDIDVARKKAREIKSRYAAEGAQLPAVEQYSTGREGGLGGVRAERQEAGGYAGKVQPADSVRITRVN